MQRWRSVAPILALMLSLCGVVAFAASLDIERHAHAQISFARALEILKTVRDEELREAARGVIHDGVAEALRLVRAAAAAGDLPSQAMLAHWGVR